MVYIKNLKNFTTIHNTHIFYNDVLNYRKIQNYLIYISFCEKKTVFVDIDFNCFMCKDSDFIETSDELIGFYFMKNFDIIFVPWLTKAKYEHIY